MANEQDRNPTTGAESDMSKAQSQQQPPSQASQASQQPAETGQQGNREQSGDQAATGQAQTGQASGAGPDEGLQGDTLSQQRTDIEGASQQSPERGEAESGFVGSQGQQDSSSELIQEEDEDFGKDGQGAPEGK